MPAIITDQLVGLDLKAPDRHGVLRELANRLEGAGRVRPSFLDGLLRREAAYPTGLPTGGGVAIPHTDPEHVISDAVAVATLARPVPFGVMAGDPEERVDVNLVFVLALGGAEGHLDLLTRLVGAVQDESFTGTLRDLTSPREVADHVTARLGL